MRTKALTMITLIIALTSCAADAAQQSSPPTATNAPTVAPTPTATPIDIPGEFAAQMGTASQKRADISGTVHVGDGAGTISGFMEFAGPNSHQRIVIAFPGGESQETEVIVHAGASYALEDGIWIRKNADPGAGDQSGLEAILDAALADPDGLALAGTETTDRGRLHRLEIRPAPEIPAELVGFTDPTFAEFEATVAFLAEDDGTPAGIILEATWLQGEEALDGVLEMRFIFDNRVSDVEVTAPEDPWEVRVGVELGYRMAYPVDWTVNYVPATEEFLASDEFLAPVDDGVRVVAYPDLQGARNAEEWFRWSAQTLMQDFGSEPAVSDTFTQPDGSEVRILSLYFEEGPDTIFFQQAVVVRGTKAWDINWYSLAGDEMEDGATMLQMILTFEPAG
jgi:hypothetical protein